MLPVDFEGTNLELGTPERWSEERTLPTRALKDIDTDGNTVYFTAWKPSKEDIDAILAGRPVFLKIVYPHYPPTLLFTTDDNGDMNYDL